jgi:hypothetical protein
MTAYVDLQAYYQKRMQLPTATQVGLAKAGEALQIDEQDIAHHRALDDSVLSGQVLQKIYDKKSFDQAVLPANASFYDRITFKVSYVTDVTDPLVKRDYLRFYCEQCGRKLQFKGKWRPHNRSLCSTGICTACNKKYTARVQIKKKYDAVDVKRKLIEKAEPDPEKEQQKKEEATV